MRLRLSRWIMTLTATALDVVMPRILHQHGLIVVADAGLIFVAGSLRLFRISIMEFVSTVAITVAIKSIDGIVRRWR